jgi:hypothetical protein
MQLIYVWFGMKRLLCILSLIENLGLFGLVQSQNIFKFAYQNLKNSQVGNKR